MTLYTWHRTEGQGSDRRYSSFAVCKTHADMLCVKDPSSFGTQGAPEGSCCLYCQEESVAQRER